MATSAAVAAAAHASTQNDARHPTAVPRDVDSGTPSTALIERFDSGETGLAAVFEHVGASLGAGIAGLVNLHDPDVVTLGGFAPSLRACAGTSFDDAYVAGLMAFRKATPPAVLDGVHGEDGSLRGACCRGIDHITTEAALAEWAAR